MKLVNLNCPNCGGKTEFDENKEFGFCQHCGTRMMINDEIQKIEVTNHTNTAKLLELIEQAHTVSEKYNYCKKILELDPSNVGILLYKGIYSTDENEKIKSLEIAVKKIQNLGEKFPQKTMEILLTEVLERGLMFEGEEVSGFMSRIRKENKNIAFDNLMKRVIKKRFKNIISNRICSRTADRYCNILDIERFSNYPKIQLAELKMEKARSTEALVLWSLLIVLPLITWFLFSGLILVIMLPLSLIVALIIFIFIQEKEIITRDSYKLLNKEMLEFFESQIQ